MGTVIPLSSSSETIATAQFTKTEEKCTRQDIIVELSARLSQKEAELRAANKKKDELEKRLSEDPNYEIERAYEGLLAHMAEREEVHRYDSIRHDNLLKRQQELESAYNHLQSALDTKNRLLAAKEENIANLEKNKQECEERARSDIEKIRGQLRDAIEAQRTALEEKNEKIDLLDKSNDTVNHLRREIERYKKIENDAIIAAEEKERSLADKDNTISELESTISDLMKELEECKKSRNEETRKLEAKQTMMNLQDKQNEELRTRIVNLEDEVAEQVNIINTYESRFKTRFGDDVVDIASLISRCDEADILWSKIEERQKKFAAKEKLITLLYEENATLRNQEKELRNEISELQRSFDTVKLELAGENIDTSYVVSQLRNTTKLKDRIVELEEIVEGAGFTKDLIEEMRIVAQKEAELNGNIEKVNSIFEMLKPQVGDGDIDVPRLIGKLEECLDLFSEDNTCEDGHSKASSVEECEEDDYTINSNHSAELNVNSADSKFGFFKCTGSNNDGHAVTDFFQDFTFGLRSIKNEGFCATSDCHGFCAAESNFADAFRDEKEDGRQ